jgi:hypothetical protein
MPLVIFEKVLQLRIAVLLGKKVLIPQSTLLIMFFPFTLAFKNAAVCLSLMLVFHAAKS